MIESIEIIYLWYNLRTVYKYLHKHRYTIHNQCISAHALIRIITLIITKTNTHMESFSPSQRSFLFFILSILVILKISDVCRGTAGRYFPLPPSEMKVLFECSKNIKILYSTFDPSTIPSHFIYPLFINPLNIINRKKYINKSKAKVPKTKSCQRCLCKRPSNLLYHNTIL